MKGGVPKPDIVKIAAGTFRKHRQKSTPKPRNNLPDCPFPAKSIAAKKWAEVVEGLEHFKLIDKIDSTHIEGLCVAYEQAKKADAQVKKDGQFMVGALGTMIKHPCVQISAEAWKLVRAYSNDLGLNHLSRQRMQAQEEPDTNNDLEQRYLN